MKLNTNFKITGQNVVLVPYKEEHVLKYYEWMQSEQLRQQTGTPFLTLQQEYEIQKSWNDDETKCTFIILNKSIFDKNNNEVEAMVGETNICLFDNEPSSAEIEIIMFDPSSNGKKMGSEAISLMLLYGIQHLNIQSFQARTSMANEINISFFTRLSFKEVSKSETFEEVTYEKVIDGEWTTRLIHDNPFQIQTL